MTLRSAARPLGGALLAVAVILAVMIVVGCGDRRRADDHGADVRVDSGVLFDIGEADINIEKGATFDLSVDAAGSDTAQTDASADLGPLTPDLGNVGPGDTCYNPIPLSWNGNAEMLKWKGSFPYATSRVTLPGSAYPDCASWRTSGPEIFFSFTVPKDGRYLLRSSIDYGALYVFTDCADVFGSCVRQTYDPKGANARLLTLRTKTTYIVALDQEQTPWGPDTSGWLTVTPAPEPGNDTCGNAQLVTFVNGRALLDAKLSVATDTNSGQQFTCPQGGLRKALTGGVDLFFRVPMIAGRAYRLMSPYPHAYVLSGCGSSAQCLAGSYADQQVWSYGVSPRDALAFHPQKSGDYIVVVDSEYPTSYPPLIGPPLHLQNRPAFIEERVTAPNDSCPGAEPIAIAGKSKVTIKGDLTDFLDDSYCANACCSSSLYASPWKDEESPDVYYRLPTELGKQYKLSCGGCTHRVGATCEEVHGCKPAPPILQGTGSDVIVRVEGKAAFALTVEVLP